MCAKHQIAAQLLDCDFLVYGASSHRADLDHLLSSAAAGGAVRLLFPWTGRDQTVGEALTELLADRGVNAVDMGFEAEESPTRAPRLTMIVPDGSWANARALVTELGNRCPQLRGVRLNDRLVAAHESPLIEALRAGCGRGRVSTLEAMALFLREVADDAVGGSTSQTRAFASEDASTLLDGLAPLVEHVRRERAACQPAVGPSPANLQVWTSALEAAVASRGEDLGIVPGLRQCLVCGAALSTPLRMKAHIRGRKHCEAVAKSFLLAEARGALSECTSDIVSRDCMTQPSQAVASQVLLEFSDRPLSCGAIEPPDLALESLSRVITGLKMSCKNDSAFNS